SHGGDAIPWCDVQPPLRAIACRSRPVAAAPAGTAGRRPESEAMSRKRFWGELKSSEFSELDPNATVAVLPVAAIEQHGPHLPVMTDTAIMQGMIDTVLARLPDELAVLFLPIPPIDKSNEHL